MVEGPLMFVSCANIFPFVFHFSVSFVYSLIFACIGVHEANHCKALVNLILSYHYGLHFTSYIYAQVVLCT